MQKKIIALAVAGLVSGAAFAQNNVTIYGVADAGLEVGNYGDGYKTRIQSGQSAGSRLGFKGEEALGNGLKAIWTLEMGVSYDNGQSTTHTTNTASSANGVGTASVSAANGGANVTNGNSIFQRQSFAGLASDKLGQVTFGRQYTPGFYVKAKADAFGLGMGGTANNTWVKLAAFTPDRLENEVQYLTPNFSGFQAGLGYSSGNEVYNSSGTTAITTTTSTQATSASKKTGQTWAALATYQGYGFDVGFAYHDVKGAVGATALGLATTATYTGAQDQNAKTRGYVLGGNYDFKVAKVFAGYASGKSTRSGTASATDGDNLSRGNVWNLGVKVPFGAHSVTAQYSRFNDKMTADADFTVWGLGYEYAMSKRTALYAGYAHGTNKNNGLSTLNTAVNTGMAITSNSASGGSGLGYDPSVYNFGMRHSF